MRREDWLNKQVENPEKTSDYYSLYDDFRETFDAELTMESYKRVVRRAFFEVNGSSFSGTDSSPQDSPEVVLNRLTEVDNKLELTLKSYKIQDVEDAAKIAGIDLSTWKCYSKTVHASQNTTNPWFIVEGKFKPKDVKDISPEEMIENFKELLQEHTPPTFSSKPIIKDVNENVALFNFYDHHIGKRISGDITGNGEEWTTALAKESMLRATDYFINEVKDSVSSVLFILGNDLLNIDNPEGTTTKGTPQKNDIDFKNLILQSTDLLITVLEKLLANFKVEVIVVPGNHDSNMAFMIGEIIKRYFTTHEGITIDNSLAPIKYWSFGENAIGFTHGSEQIKKKYVLPMLMAQQKPELMACKYREFHTGHLHQTKKTQLTEIVEDYGVTLRTLPTLSPTCEWAAGKGYQGIQATECIVYNKTKGPIATYRYSE